MKKLFQKLLFVALAASIGFLYSCGEDEEVFDVPVITFSVPSGSSVEVGEDLELTVTVVAPGGFNVLRASNGTETVEFPRGSQGVTMNADNTQADVTLTLGSDEVGEFDFTFTAVDDQDQVTEVVYTIVATSPSVTSHTQTLLGGQLNSTLGSFYNAVDDVVYGYADFRDNNSANTDFLFFYGTTNMYTIASIVDADANIAFNAAIGDGALSASVIATRNESLFKPLTLTSAEFDAISNEAELLNAYGEVAATDTKVNGLEAGDVFAVVLDADRDSKVALVKVVATAGTSGTDRSITIEVKIQAAE